MRTIIHLTAKDLRQQLRNGTLLLFAVVLPLGLAFMFNSLMAPGDPQLNVSYGVVDEDGGELATVFTNEVLTAIATDSSFEIEPVTDRETAHRLLDDQDQDAVFILPAGFTDQVNAGQEARIDVIGHPDAGIAVQIAREIAQAFAAELRGVQLAVAVGGADDPDADPAHLAEQAAELAAPVVLAVDDSVDDRELSSNTHYSAGMAVFFLFFTAMLSVSGLLEERSQGTMARLLAAPSGRPAILAGKLLSSVVVGVAAMTVLIGASTLLLGASWGDLRGVAVLVVAVVLAAVAIMALLCSFANTAEQASNWMSVLAVLFGLFGGSFVPLAQFGGLAVISYATPHRWFLQGLSELTGAGPAAAIVPALVLTGIAAVAFAVTLLRIDKVVRA
ncbi:ABC transporter permease [Natronosporangium hydrolyticum]|uniref:ABC transporter permease n=1 Tax=Natronosporangium hydrolyticum TaxID=2811111 RepID=A0A895YER0_9ACTN|nr:ABC transporter permease [Natronosporangium hydrolyticum]QSB12710.1 ABC transporter permease [Natronosporangium hydrolyticum]